MRPIPATRLGDAHGLLRAIENARAAAHGRVRHRVQSRRAVPARARERGRTPASLHLLRPARGARQGGPRGRRADRHRQALRPFRRSRRAVRHLPAAGRVAASPAARASHDGLDLPRARDRAQPARVRPGRHADLDDGLRPLDGLPRPRGLGQREHAPDPGRATPHAAHGPRADRRRPSSDGDRRAGPRRAHAARAHVAAGHRRAAEPGRRRGRPRGGLERVRGARPHRRRNPSPSRSPKRSRTATAPPTAP